MFSDLSQDIILNHIAENFDLETIGNVASVSNDFAKQSNTIWRKRLNDLLFKPVGIFSKTSSFGAK